MQSVLSFIVMYPATSTVLSVAALLVIGIAASSRRNRLIVKALFALLPLAPIFILRGLAVALIFLLDLSVRSRLFAAQHDAAMFLYKVTHDEK